MNSSITTITGQPINLEHFQKLYDTFHSKSRAFVYLLVRDEKILPEVWKTIETVDEDKAFKDLILELPHDRIHLVEEKKRLISRLFELERFGVNDLTVMLPTLVSSSELTFFLLTKYHEKRNGIKEEKKEPVPARSS